MTNGGMTQTQVDLLWGFLYAAMFNFGPNADRPKLTKREYERIADAQSRLRRTDRFNRQEAIRHLETKRMIESRKDGGWLITADGRALLKSIDERSR